MDINKAFQAKDVHFAVTDCKNRKEPGNILMTTPQYFDIVDVKNVHMEGQAGNLNKELAQQQWKYLKGIYDGLKQEQILEEVYVLPGAAGCEDMVFCANQSFPWLSESGQKEVILSKMFHDSRRREVSFFESFYKNLGYTIIHLQNTQYFEGMGDTIPHPEKRLLYGGYGHRTSADAYDEIAEILQVPVVLLELKDPRFYHLDTCFVPLSIETVMLCMDAFTAEGLNVLSTLFKKIILIPPEEANQYFSLNAHVIARNGKKAAILQQGSKETMKALSDEGFKIKEVDTSEYMKSGGSVFCMKMMIY